MYIEGSAAMPKDESGIAEFDKVVATAKEAGVKVIRTAFGQRRYEQFEKAEEYREFASRCRQSMVLAEPVAARSGIRLAIENHKDWLIPDMIGILEHVSSEYVGVCVDTGNSFALLEDPLEMVKAYAPWAFSTHIKDLALAEYEDGFLLADVALGEGLLDLAEMARIMRQAKPDVKWTLEMATRDALEVPCLTERYWATFEDRPAVELARALKYVRDNAKNPGDFTTVSALPTGQQIKLEEDNVKKCLTYASEKLK
jgi:sugar phosphate isomerase/epimerase